MKNTILLFAIFFSVTLLAQDRSINFKDYTFYEALEASAKENKPIFMDCYAVWCGPCKWMSANIFTLNEVADYYNENFICVKFDMEKGEGIDLAKEFGIRAYPTLIFVNADRELIMKSIGASQEKEAYITLGGNALSDEFNLIALSENVAENREDAAYMSKYFEIMSGAGMADDEEVRIYFSKIPKEEWGTKDNWKIILAVVDDVNSDVFQDVLNDTEKYRKENGEQVDQYITYNIQNALGTLLYSRAPNANQDYLALLEKVKTWNFEGKDGVIFLVESTRLKKDDQQAYMQFCVDNVENAIWNNANQLNSIAWYFFENTEESEYLVAAEKWAARAVELEPKSHAILDTYANLLMANGKYKQALETETRALDLAKATDADISSYMEVIEQIKSKM